MVVLLLLNFPLRGDSRSDLQHTLVTLKGTRPVQASVLIEITRKSEGRFANNSLHGSASAEASVDASGLTVRVGLQSLQRAVAEDAARDVDPNRTTPTRSSLEELSPVTLSEAFNFADPLRRLVGLATTAVESRVSFNGKPARLLVMSIATRIPKEARTVWNVHFSEDQLRVWVADDGTPLAAERTRKGTAGFMFLRGEMRSRDHWTFARVDDRLIVTRHEVTFTGSGLGQRSDGRTVTIITLR